MQHELANFRSSEALLQSIDFEYNFHNQENEINCCGSNRGVSKLDVDDIVDHACIHTSGHGVS